MSIIFFRAKNWVIERKGWIMFWSIAVLLIILSFCFGYLMGKRDNPAPIIIEQRSAS